MDDDELEERYSDWKNEVLKELRTYIVDQLEPHKLFTYLRSCDILDQEDQEEIEVEISRKRKNQKLLDKIKDKGPEGFDKFCEAIVYQNVTQLFILKKILDLFQKKKDTYSGTASLAKQNIQSNSDFAVMLPVPGGPGGPVIPYFEMPEENIMAANNSRQEGRPRSPPPVYSEY